MLRILLARHGVSESNLRRQFQGHLDITLVAAGETQAQQLAHRLKDEPIDVVYTSDLQRAWRTAEMVAAGRAINVVREQRWRELFMGGFEGLTGAEAAVAFPELWQARQADLNTSPPGGESRVEGQRRAIANLTALREAHQNGTVLVVTHGGLLMVIYAWLFHLNTGSRDLIPHENCGLSCIEWDQGEPAAAYWNDVSHLES